MGIRKIIRGLGIGLLLGWVSLSVYAHDGELVAQPKKCVSLKQGNICYADVTFSWTMPAPADYCLYQDDQNEPLKCWQQTKQGKHTFEFAYPATQIYSLRRAGEDEALAQTRVEVKWVYKMRNSRKFDWRVF